MKTNASILGAILPLVNGYEYVSKVYIATEISFSFNTSASIINSTFSVIAGYIGSRTFYE